MWTFPRVPRSGALCVLRCDLRGLHSAYVRGKAYLAARQYAEAAVEFQKILGHRWLVGLDPIGTMAHLRLGGVFVGPPGYFAAPACGCGRLRFHVAADSFDSHAFARPPATACSRMSNCT